MASTRPASRFTRFARVVARMSGRPAAFTTAAATILIWAVAGPAFHYSDAWQLTVNTATTIVTFLMVFLIQGTQFRDSEAVQVKLDELIRAVHGAKNTLIDLEDLDDEELERLLARYGALAKRARAALGRARRRESASRAEVSQTWILLHALHALHVDSSVLFTLSAARGSASPTPSRRRARRGRCRSRRRGTAPHPRRPAWR